MPGDTNQATDVFVRDRLTGVTERVSVGPGGRQANSDSIGAAISPGGRYVAFTSYASNLVPGDTNYVGDVFVRDRVDRVTRRVSIGPGGRQANSGSSDSAISADGRYVVFTSLASNLVPGDTNQANHVFVRDRVDRVTRRVSVGPGGRQANSDSFEPAISPGGRYVAFRSYASNLVPGDTNNEPDVFVRNRVDRVTRRVSIGPGGRQANSDSIKPAISPGGRYVAFESYASNLVPGDTNRQSDVFVRDRVDRVTRRVSVGPGGRQANRHSIEPAISRGGRYVAFYSFASNLVPGDAKHAPDVFVRDRVDRVTRLVSVGPGGQQANGGSFSPAISADGRHVAFHSGASNLVPGDTNGWGDVFVWDRFGDVARDTTNRPAR
ncbi:MAG: hypothetical protein H0W95_00040 [Nocardioidaceae bacterium]|nr:hypothetical protein [Nocardioidaceae bacterium]